MVISKACKHSDVRGGYGTVWLCWSRPGRNPVSGQLIPDYHCTKNKDGNCRDYEAKPPIRSIWRWLTRRG